MTSPHELTAEQDASFDVHLENFEGPFDLLLQLISRHELDVTTVALSRVTNDFIAHIKAGEPGWDLDKTSSFLLVAATLLDAKAARLLPGGEVTEPEDLAALEARDLLFARLLQYRAFRQLAEWIEQKVSDASHIHWRPGGIEERFARVLPRLSVTIDASQLAILAVRALTPRPSPQVELGHLHAPAVSVAEQTAFVAKELQHTGQASFRALVMGCDRLLVVARFLAVLELFRSKHITFEQATPLSELYLRWIGASEIDIANVDEYQSQRELEPS